MSFAMIWMPIKMAKDFFLLWLGLLRHLDVVLNINGLEVNHLDGNHLDVFIWNSSLGPRNPINIHLDKHVSLNGYVVI